MISKDTKAILVHSKKNEGKPKVEAAINIGVATHTPLAKASIQHIYLI